MRAKPDMKPWVSTDKSKMSSFRCGTYWGTLTLGLCHPYGAQKCVSMPSPGRKPWARQEYRPYRAHLRLSNQYTLLFC